MRVITSLLVFVFCFTSFAQSNAKLPHLDFEMNGFEYLPLIEAKLRQRGFEVRPELSAILQMGKRNLEWFEHVNKFLEVKLELSTPETTVGIPIDGAKLSNEKLILERYKTWSDSAPDSFKSVLTGTGQYPDAAPMGNESFLALTRQFDSIYQQTSRWVLQSDYLWVYSGQAKKDVRGFYFLNKETDLENKLNNYGALSSDDKAKLKSWLVGQCYNGSTLSTCQSKFDTAVSSKKVWEYHLAARPAAQALWDSFFKLKFARTDATWNTSNVNVMSIPFKNPSSEVKQWLIENVEPIWRFNSWQLHLEFLNTSSSYTTYIVFDPGATPNVSGSRITMDANRPLNEYLTRWTIGHEYGHILGFPDCYVEFYDETLKAMVNYQLDIDNIMCSRKGKFQQLHYDELHKGYFKASESESAL